MLSNFHTVYSWCPKSAVSNHSPFGNLLMVLISSKVEDGDSVAVAVLAAVVDVAAVGAAVAEEVVVVVVVVADFPVGLSKRAATYSESRKNFFQDNCFFSFYHRHRAHFSFNQISLVVKKSCKSSESRKFFVHHNCFFSFYHKHSTFFL